MKLDRLFILGLGIATLLTGCVTTTPSTMTHQPMTVRPEPRPPAGATQGAIYNTASARPLFEDRRARFVGDIITINVIEKTAASKNSQNTAERTHEMESGITTIAGLPLKSLQGTTFAAGSNNSFNGKGQNTSTNDFTSTITCTVIEVLPNGNLLVSGEKQIGLKDGEEFIRFSGVVNPNTITGANTVQSVQVADARLEYRANGFLDTTTAMGWLARFFNFILPIEDLP